MNWIIRLRDIKLSETFGKCLKILTGCEKTTQNSMFNVKTPIFFYQWIAFQYIKKQPPSKKKQTTPPQNTPNKLTNDKKQLPPPKKKENENEKR